MSKRKTGRVLRSRLHLVWRRTQFKHLSAGFLAMCRWIIPLFLIGMVVDRFTHLPTEGRVVILAILVAVCLFKAWRSGWRHLRFFNAERTALQVEQQHGGLESLLVTAVQLGKSKAPSGTSAALWEATCNEADGAVRALNTLRIASFKSLRLPLIAAAVFAIGMLVYAVIDGPIVKAGLARIFNPWAETVYPTKTKLDLGAGDLVVKEGDRAQIAIGVSGVVPDKAKLSLRTGEGRPRELELEIIDGSAEYTIASASRDFSYRIKAGDARSEWHEVKVITAPRIKEVQVELEFPAYLEREPETVEALTLTVPQETKVHWQLTLDRSISAAKLHRDGEEPLALEVTGEGLQLVIEEAVDASRGYSFSWVEEEYGFDFTSPRYYLQVASDQTPQVELTSPDSNLDAMLGRELRLGIRARDDHGIGTASITYRVNLRPEKTVAIETPIQNGGGEQVLEWDYRDALPDLKIGDTVSFVVEVADKYPDGPHTARSETRRITFLSREEYLAQIEKKKDRLLSRVRTTYRQERAAHELVRELNPRDESFVQTCQLEAIRQEMLRQQLKDIAREVQVLLDDLEANKVTDAVEADTLVRVRTGLETIAEERFAKAASLLREQTGAAASGDADPTAAIQTVNQAARELAGLVLQGGIDYAREVLARESHMLATEQATLRLLVAQAGEGDDAKSLAARQEELASWTDELIVSLREGMRYDKRPISVLGLTRRLKELRASGAEDKMRKAAALIGEGKATGAAALQSEIITPLLAAEFSMRTGAEYAAVTEFRKQLDALFAAQQELRAKGEAMSAEEFATGRVELATSQAALQAALIPALLPPVPSPRARLFDSRLPELPPIAARRTAAEQALTEALTRLQAGEQTPAVEKQSEAETELATLVELLQQAAVELSLRTEGLNSLVSTATERVTQIEDYEARQILLLEQTEEAALDEVDSKPLAEPQQFLTEEIADFRDEMRGKGEADKDVLPLLSRLDQLDDALAEATKVLGENRPEDALEHQEESADHLAVALELAQAQAERLSLLQDLHSFQRSVGTANQWMVDIVAEQNDLAAATKAAKPEDAATLTPVMNNLRQCLKDIAPVLDLVAGRLDAGTPLVFAETDLEDAVFSIEAEDYRDAADAQEVAAESLAEVQGLVSAVQGQTGYVAEIVEFLHASQADVALMAFRQQQIREKLASAEGEVPPALVTEQIHLQTEAEAHGRQLARATGMTSHTTAGAVMREAHSMLTSGDAAGAAARMEAAEATLLENAEELYLVITMLHGLPSIEVFSTSPEELVLLLEVLSFTSEQRTLSRQTEAAQAGGFVGLATQQVELEKTSAKALRLDPPHPMLVSANQHLATAAAALQSSDKAQGRQAQASADEVLRHFIIEQALILETAKAAPAASDDPVESEAETDDLSVSVASFVSDFVSGEAPKDQKTEWEVLGNRNRAALNQNFARELPLEYRGTLKNYYERVAK